MFPQWRPKSLEALSLWVFQDCSYRLVPSHQYQFTIGFTNSSLYTGDIDYVNMPVQGSYWILPMSCSYYVFLHDTANPDR
jgi:hypothetical protein